MEQLAYFQRGLWVVGLGLLEGLVPEISGAMMAVVHNLVDAMAGNLAMFQNVHPNIVMFHLLMTECGRVVSTTRNTNLLDSAHLAKIVHSKQPVFRLRMLLVIVCLGSFDFSLFLFVHSMLVLDIV